MASNFGEQALTGLFKGIAAQGDVAKAIASTTSDDKKKKKKADPAIQAARQKTEKKKQPKPAKKSSAGAFRPDSLTKKKEDRFHR